VYELGLADTVCRLLDQVRTLELDPLNATRIDWLEQIVTGKARALRPD
jgi:hypothetical protein